MKNKRKMKQVVLELSNEKKLVKKNEIKLCSNSNWNHDTDKNLA